MTTPFANAKSRISMCMAVPMQGASLQNLRHLTTTTNADLNVTFGVQDRAVVSVNEQAHLIEVSTALPTELPDAVKSLTNTLKTLQQNATRGNITISDTALLTSGQTVAKSVITLYADNKELAARQGEILKRLTTDAQSVFGNTPGQTDNTSFEVCTRGSQTHIIVDSSPHMVETAALLHVLVGTNDACRETERVLSEKPPHKNALHVLFDANHEKIAAVLSDAQTRDLGLIVSGQRAATRPSMVPYGCAA